MPPDAAFDPEGIYPVVDTDSKRDRGCLFFKNLIGQGGSDRAWCFTSSSPVAVPRERLSSISLPRQEEPGCSISRYNHR